MSKLKTVKTLASTVVSIGSGAIVGNIVMATMPMGTGLLMRGAISVASYAISNIVTSAATKQIEKEIDEVVDAVKGAAVEAAEKEKGGEEEP